jgi:hypothetical protein
VNVKTIAGWTAIAFAVWWVIENPHGASDLVAHVGTFLSTAASGLSNFVASI